MDRCLTELLLEWQAVGDHECFARLVKAASPVVEETATRWLRRLHRFTTAHVDEVLSLVLDHLRRLHPGSGAEAAVAVFRPEPDGSRAAGLRYVRWLARSRAQDLVRAERRRVRRQPTLFEAGVNDAAVAAVANRGGLTGEDGGDGRPQDLRRAMAALPRAEREVIERLLEGQSQGEVAAAMSVAEGTISRRKVKAVMRLRDLLRPPPPRPRPPLPAGWPVSQPVNQPVAAPGPSAGPRVEPPPSLPLVSVQYEMRRAADDVVRRRFRWLAFGCLLDGEVTLTWSRNGQEQTSHQTVGTCNFFTPDDAESTFRWHPGREARFHTILVPPEYVAGVAAAEGLVCPACLRPWLGFRDQVIEATIRSIRQAREAGDDLGQECGGRSLVLRLLELQGCGKPGWGLGESLFAAAEARRIAEYVDAHLHGRIMLADLARVAGLSRGHFNRKCHRSFGVTPSRFVTIRRVQRIVDLLKNTSEPLEEIARATGFCSPSHCTNTFRSIVGTPPSQFRAELRRT